MLRKQYSVNEIESLPRFHEVVIQLLANQNSSL